MQAAVDLRWRTHLALRSIRSRLLVFALVCSIPLLTALVAQRSMDQERIEADAQRRVTALADQLQAGVVARLGMLQGLAHATGAMYANAAGDEAVCSAALRRSAQAARADLLNLSILDPEGRLACSALPPGGPAVFSDRPYFQRAVRLKKAVLSGYTLGRVTKAVAIQLAVPQVTDGALTAVAVIAIPPFGLLDDFLPQPDEVALDLFDSEGVLLARHPPRPDVEPGKRYFDAALFTGADGRFSEFTGPDGVTRTFALRAVRLEGEVVLWAAVGVDIRGAQAAAAAARRTTGLLVLAVLVLVAGTAAMLTHPLVLSRTRPLLQAAERARQGDLSVRVPITARDELTRLERAFNDMFRSIEHERSILADNEERYRLLFHNVVDGVLNLDASGRIVAANPAACMLLRGAEQLTGTTWAQLLDPLDPRAQAVVALHEDGAQNVARVRLKRGDGSTVECEVTGRRYQAGARGSAASFVIRDATLKLDAEQRAEELNRRLTQMVAIRTAELEGALGDMKTLTYTLSHDLKTPVVTIGGFVEALSRRDMPWGEKERHYLGRIKASCAHGVELIDGILALARISRTTLRLEEVELVQLAHEALATTGVDTTQLLFDAPGSALVHGDRQLLRILVDNLVGNAVKFSSRTSRPVVRLEVERQGPYEVKVCVRDNGAGFDPEYAHKLFKPFQRLHGVHEFPGTGLGLAAVKRVVARHAGRVWAESGTGTGTGAAFFFTLWSEHDPGEAAADADSCFASVSGAT